MVFHKSLRKPDIHCELFACHLCLSESGKVFRILMQILSHCFFFFFFLGPSGDGICRLSEVSVLFMSFIKVKLYQGGLGVRALVGWESGQI